MGFARTRLQRIGDSVGIVLSADQLREAGLAEGDEVDVQVEKGRVVITALDPDCDETVADADRFVAGHPNALKKLGE